MMKRDLAFGVVLAAAIGLSACGGAGGVDLSGRLTDICIKERGEADRAACECASRAINEGLAEPDRKLAMFSIDAEQGRFKNTEEARSAFASLGFDPEKAAEITNGFVMRMMTLEASANARCSA